MYFMKGTALLAALILSIAGTALAQTKNVEEIIAWVNNDIILKSEYEKRKAELRAELAQPKPQGAGLSGAQLDQVFNDRSKTLMREMIDEALLLQQAKDLGLNGESEVIKTMDQLRQQQHLDSMEAWYKAIVDQGYNLDDFRQNIRSRYLTSQVIQRQVSAVVTNEELRKYYEENKKNFDRPAGVQLAEIVFLTENRSPEGIESQRKKAEEALAAVKKGDDFAQVAAKYSESGTAENGGDLGFTAKGELAPSLEEIISKLDKGQVSDIIPVQGAFMILKVVDKHAGGVLPFELAQKEVFGLLYDQAMQPKIREYLTKLRNDGFVKTAEGYVDTGAAQKSEKVSEAK